MQAFTNFLYYHIIAENGFVISPINLLIFLGLFIFGKLLIKYLYRFVKSTDLKNKHLTVEGKEIPVWRLTRQLIWLAIFFIGFKSLMINNPHLETAHLFAYEFFRFGNFHFAVYHIFLLIVLYFAIRIILSLVRIYLLGKVKNNARLDQGTEYVYLQLIKYVIYCITIIILFRSFGLNLDLFMRALTFLLVGVALGLQDVFKDFFSGFLLLFEGAVKVGDIVEIERLDGQENFVAKIVEINLRSSKVETRDGNLLIIPNAHLTFEKVNNWSAGNKITRFMIPVTVRYGSDLQLVKKLLIDAAKSHGKVVKNRDVVVRLLNFGNHGLELDLVFWADKNFFIEIHKSDIRFEIDKKFREHGIEYPFNQLDVHFDKGSDSTVQSINDIPPSEK